MQQQTFTNEKGNKIDMSVRAIDGSVTVDCKGPNSRVVHRWTRLEAEKLRDQLDAELAQ